MSAPRSGVDPRAMVVARRAAELAAAVGVELADDLPLWGLAGGRPRVEAVAGEPDELGDLLEAAFTPEARQRHGAHYTPAALAAALVDRALAGRDRPTVGDPACGGGALLLAAARYLEARGASRIDAVAHLWGMDVDPLAVATAEAALSLWSGGRPERGHLVVSDALQDPAPWPAVDVIVGNPPFLSQLDVATTRSAAATARLRGRFGSAVRAYTDTAGLFLLAACDLVEPNGTVALLQPQSVLGARDAAGVRDAVGAVGRLTDVWFPTSLPFANAAVEVCLPIIEVGSPQPSASWSRHLARAQGVPPVELASGPVLSDEATTIAGFRSEYYGMVDHVHEQADCSRGAPLVTTGLVDLAHCAWGERAARVGRRSFQRPVLDVAALGGRGAAWARRTGQPKLLVATQTRVMEVAVDETGEWIPGVPLVVVLAPSERLWPLAAALASPSITAWALHQVAGTARAPHALKVTAALLRRVPLPPDRHAWAVGTDALRAGALETYAVAMGAAYGSESHVADWWLARVGTVWSPAAARK